MPEGPELARSRDQLQRVLVGKYIHEIIPLEGGRYGSDDQPIVGLDAYCDENNAAAQAQGHQWALGQLIKEIGVKGKFMWWHVGDWFLWCTYGMSGQWNPEYDPKHSAVQVAFNESPDPVRPCTQMSTINFNDHRHFGTIKLVKGREALDKKLQTLGPDMLASPPSDVVFLDRLYRRDAKTVAEALMDQSVISGVGNYVKAEALYLAEISPHRTINSLSTPEIVRLRHQIINVMKAAYNTGGATISTYRNPDGSKGTAQQRFMVYGNKTDPMGNPVVREETADGRTTWWVPTIQR